MKIIKLGGSLLSSGGLSACLTTIIERYDKQIVIVAGGGSFADQVRQAQQDFQFNDYCAHAMALLAMQQTAWLIKGLEPRFVLADSIDSIKQLAANHIVLWLPNLSELNKANVPATWAITSDSLAAWLAKMLNADELLLIKSIDSPLNLVQLQEQGIVDQAFCDMAQGVSVRVLHYQTFAVTKNQG